MDRDLLIMLWQFAVTLAVIALAVVVAGILIGYKVGF